MSSKVHNSPVNVPKAANDENKNAAVSVRKCLGGDPRSLIGLCLLAAALVVGRAVFTKGAFVAGNDPTAEQAKMPQPPFCTVPDHLMEKLFYYDLGGTYCVCEKRWSVTEYWQKTLSGLAFNFPHLVDGFVFTFVIGDFNFILLGIFANEMFEEFLLTSGHWGYNFDPPYDLEPRYDTLMRDTIHAIFGALLAHDLAKVLKSRPWCAYPPRLDFSLPSSDKHSPMRWFKTIISLVFFWQLMLLYNADSGIGAFSKSNALLCVYVLAWFLATYMMNRSDFPETPARRVLLWHLIPGLFTLFACLLSVYPLMSTIYLIMICEGVLKLATIGLDAALAADLWGLRQWCDFDPVGEQDDATAAAVAATDINVEGGAGQEGIEWGEEQQAATVALSQELTRVSQRDRGIAALLRQRPDLGSAVLAALRADEAAETAREEATRGPWGSPAKKAKTIALVAVAFLFIVVGITEPLQYTTTTSVTGAEISVSYGRHWCGNPKATQFNVNTCSTNFAPSSTSTNSTS